MKLAIPAKDSATAAGIIGAHGLEHLYGRSFLALMPAIYVSLGMGPLQAGVLDAVRQLAAGLTSTGGGFCSDLFHYRRAQILAFSMLLIGAGYLMVAVAPIDALIPAALAVAAAGSALWHPPALGYLSERFPQQRGLFISLHRSSGNIGDTLGPVIIGALLLVVGWRWVAGGGFPLTVLAALFVIIFMGNVGGPNPGAVDLVSNARSQLRSTAQAFKGTGMWAIFTVSAIRGVGDRSLQWVIPLYLAQALGKSSLEWGYHLALLAAPGIITAPLLGALSDRVGRKPVLVSLMAIAVFLPITMLLGGGGLGMTMSVVVFGMFHASANSLTQAAAVDVVEGRGLDGTFIGLMWGSNTLFGAVSSVIIGLLVGILGAWDVAFYFASALFFVGFLASLAMPSTGGTRRRPSPRAGTVGIERTPAG